MKKEKLLLVIGLCIFPISSKSETWGEIGVQEVSPEKIVFEINTVVRFRKNLESIYKYKTDIRGGILLGENIHTGIYFRNDQEYILKKWKGTNFVGIYGSGKLEEKGRYSLLTKHYVGLKKLKEWKWRGHLEGRKSFLLHTVRTTTYGAIAISYKWGYYLEEEIDFSFQQKKLEENRIYLGGFFEIHPYFRIKLGGLLNTKRVEKELENVGGIVVKMEFYFRQTD